MRWSEIRDLRRFLPGGPKPEPARLAPWETALAASQTVDFFARDAVLALRQLEQSLMESDAVEALKLGQRFGELWAEAGLGELDWRDAGNSDAAKILGAAAEIATVPGQNFTNRAARMVASRDRLLESPERMQAGLDAVVGEPVVSPDPATWLRESLGRLAKARVIQDLVAQGTKVVVSGKTQASMEEVLLSAHQLTVAQRGVDRAAKTAASTGDQLSAAQDRFDKTFGVTVGIVGAVVTNGLDHPPLLQAVEVAGVAAMTGRSMQAYERLESARARDSRAQGQLATGRQGLLAARDNLSAAVDNATNLPGMRSGREQPGGIRKRGGGGPGR